MHDPHDSVLYVNLTKFPEGYLYIFCRVKFEHVVSRILECIKVKELATRGPGLVSTLNIILQNCVQRLALRNGFSGRNARLEPNPIPFCIEDSRSIYIYINVHL
jgi:hypothetical protein